MTAALVTTAKSAYRISLGVASAQMDKENVCLHNTVVYRHKEKNVIFVEKSMEQEIKMLSQITFSEPDSENFTFPHM